MVPTLNAEQQSDLLRRGFSRRTFGRIATILGAGAALPFYNEHALAQMSKAGPIPADAVKIDANENPLGPSPEAVDAIYKSVKQGGRYMWEATDSLARVLAETLDVKYSPDEKSSYIQIYAGSSAPLHQAVLAFCSKDRAFVKADPGYEAGEIAAKYIGAPVVKVPLRAGTYDHDVKAMLAAAPNGGLFYICNPNNPTGTVTSRSDIEYLVRNKPQGAIVMIDEAYYHFYKEAVQCTDMAAQDKDVVVLRTFSKIYGMAGLRAGAAVARPDLLAKVRQWSAGAMPITAMHGAIASLQSKSLVPERRDYMIGVREVTCDWLASKNVKLIPSQANFFMIDVKRPGKDFRRDMAQQKVFVGRSWPVWPNWSRITVGTKEEMAKFRDAFERCYNA
ncbi:MAG: pyridoxal phosphate-dependent aminotransferase [Acidobacteriaceae bacterium]|nr:pyridoxal phosphate-dependent aminotransferase [Acidobacteriaceae bacterium]